MPFQLGKPILVLIFLAIASGISLLAHRSGPRADLVVWCFADMHAKTYREPLPATGPSSPPTPSLAEQFTTSTGKTVRVDLISQRAEDIRLVSMFMSQAAGDEVPDLCEIEIGSVGKFFRPPVDEVGLLPLNDYLKRSGQMDRIIAGRFAPWSKKDPRTGETIIFGVPHDVHPMTITYRKDLFDEAGVDPSKALTWLEFQSMCLELQRHLASHGRPESHAIELASSSPEHLIAMLLQRQINLVDSANQVHFTDPQVAQTLAFYTQLTTGPGRIGTDLAPGAGFGTQDLARGDVCALLTPDWRAGYVRQYAPTLAGRLRMMPMPRFDAGDPPTSTFGGTMIGIPRSCKNPDLAWKLIELLYLSPRGNAARIASGSGILPPVPALWTDPVYHQPDAYFGGQKVYELYCNLARQIPRQYVTPYTTQSYVALALVMRKARNYMETSGNAGLEDACRTWLAQAQNDLQRRIDFGKFD